MAGRKGDVSRSLQFRLFLWLSLAIVLVEDDDAVIIGFGSRKVRILSPSGRLTKL